MRYFVRICILLIFCSVSISAMEYFPLDDLKPGLKGYALSCFYGTEPVRLEVEITGIVRNTNPGSYQILGRVSGEPVEFGGIMAGMSGSPVYIGGKLLGALAYAFPFAKESIAGITPIQYMDPIWKIPGVPGDSTSFHPAGAGRQATDLMNPPGTRWASVPQPIQCPVAFAGMIDRAADFLEGLNWKGVIPVTGGIAGTTDSRHLFLPGGIAGVGMIDGDIRMAAMGTITAVDGQKLLAFGHSFFQGGACNLPLVGGEGAGYISSLITSYKVFNIGSVSGTVFQDLQPGVAAITGDGPRMVPVEIKWVPDTGEPRVHQIRVVDEKDLLPGLAALGTASVVSFYDATSGDRSNRIEMICSIPGREPVIMKKVTGMSLSLYEDIYSLFQGLAGIVANPVEPVRIDSITVCFESLQNHRLTFLDSIEIPDHRILPGDNLNLRLNLKSYRNEPFSRDVQVKIPSSTQPGNYTVRVMDAAEYRIYLAARRPDPLLVRELDTYLDQFRRPVSEDMLWIVILRPSVDARTADRYLPNLPPSFQAALKSSTLDIGIMEAGTAVSEHTVVFPTEIAGIRELPLTVDSYR